jgi:hypothetical protein
LGEIDVLGEAGKADVRILRAEPRCGVRIIRAVALRAKNHVRINAIVTARVIIRGGAIIARAIVRPLIESKIIQRSIGQNRGRVAGHRVTDDRHRHDRAGHRTHKIGHRAVKIDRAGELGVRNQISSVRGSSDRNIVGRPL